MSDPTAIPGLIAHLSTRTRFLRQSVADATGRLLRHIGARLMNKETLAELLKGPAARESLVSELTARGLSTEQATELVPLFLPLLPMALENAVPSLSDHVESFLTLAHTQYPTAIRDTHISALAKNPDLPERSERYRLFNWYILETDTPLLLGDTACVFETTGERGFKPFDDRDDLHRVFLPVSADRALVGTPYKSRPKIDSRRLNKAVVRCSYEFFVSSAKLPLESQLPSSLGKWSGILTEDELREIGDHVGLDRP